MRLAGLSPSKGLGQHFLIDKDSLAAIVEAAQLDPADVVLEVGPGLGTMTGVLSERVQRVVAVEADKNLAELLVRRNFKNVEVVPADILEFDLNTMPAGYKVVANIPYYLTSKLIRLLLEAANPPIFMTLLIQKEVAERITAEPGKMSILALSVQYYAEAQIVAQVERHKFWPAPKVDSAVLVLRRLAKPRFEADSAKLFRLIKAGFGEKRKQLKNSLAGGLNASIDLILSVLASAQIDKAARPQQLSLDDWRRLYLEAVKVGLI